MQATIRNLAVLVCAAAICIGSVARAQANPEMGDTSQATGTWGPPPASAEASADASANTRGEFNSSADSSSNSSSPSASPSGTGAHADVVGTFGIGFFGVIDVPICSDFGPACTTGAVAAPAIGLRYWMSELVGIEAAIGFGMRSGTRTAENPGGSMEFFDNSETAFVLHGAVPLALAYSGNFVFQVVPEMNIGLATGTIYGGTPDEDIDISGMLFQIGGRAGAEIHFGFIGLPQLSLQGTVGLHMTFGSRSGSLGTEDRSYTTTNIGTTVQNDPWDIFAGNITAIYYFMD